MRMAFGLIGLLVTVGVIVMILHFAVLPYNSAVIKRGQDARSQAEQIAGVKDGMRTDDSITLEPQTDSGGHPVSLLVTRIVIGGPMESYFGLQRNDTIVAINGMRVRDENDAELAKALALEAYQRQQKLTVVRNGQTLELPQPPAAVATPAGTATGAQPAAGTGTSSPDGGGLSGQLDAIKKAAGGAVK